MTPSSIPRCLLVCAVVACAAAGWVLRMAAWSPASVREDTVKAPDPEPAGPGMTSGALAADELLKQPPAQRLAGLAAALPRLTPEEIAAIVQSLAAENPALEGQSPLPLDEEGKRAVAMLGALFTRWVELDAPGMISTLGAPPFQFAMHTRQIAVNTWSELHGIVALEAVAGKWPRMARVAAERLLLTWPHMAESLAPWLALTGEPLLASREALLEQLGAQSYWNLAVALKNRDELLFAAGGLAAQDFPQAMQLVKSLPPAADREAVLRQLLDALVSLDEADDRIFKTEYEALPPGKLRDDLAENYARVLCIENPAAAAAWARSLPAGKAKSVALAEVADKSPERPEEQAKLFAESWLADPQQHHASVRYTGLTEPNLTYVRDIFTRPFAEWYKSDAAGATAWMNSLPDLELRAELCSAILENSALGLSLLTASSDRLDYAAAVLQGERDGSLSFPVWQPLKNPLSPDEERNATLMLAQSEGVSDEAWQAANTADRRFLSEEAVKSRASENPSKAREFFEAMAPEERSLGAWHEAGAAAVQWDVEEASQWIAELPAGPERDAAATALVEHLTAQGTERDGALAFVWAASLSGEVERARYVKEAARVWSLEDAVAARDAVSGSSLPEAEKFALLQQLPEGGAK